MSAFSDENAGIPVSPRKLLSPIQAMGLVLRDSNRANISSFPDHSFSEKTNHDVKLDNSEDDDGVISFKLPSALSDGMELNPFHPRTQIQNPPLTTNQHVQDNMTESTQSRNQHESDLETRSAAVCSQDLRESAQDSNQHKADLKTPSAAVCSQDPEMKGLFEKIELLTLNAINILDGEEYGVSPCLSKDIACGENYQNTNSIESNTHSTGVALVCSSDTLDHISTGGIKFDIDIPQVEKPFITRSQLANTLEKCAPGLDEDPFTTRSQLGNTPTKCVSGLDENPFTTKSQLGNTPTKCAPGLDEDPFTTRSQLGNTPTKCAPGLDENPFTTKSQLANTPGKCAPGLDEDPLTTKSQLGKTPEKSESGLDENPFTTKSQLGKTPEKGATGLDEDPFTTRSQLRNTPTKCAPGLDEDPFTKRSQLGNMPTKCATGLDENPFTAKSQLGKTPEKGATGLDEDPFTTRSQLGKTPEKSESKLDENPFTTKSQLGKTHEKSATGLDEDPFTTRSQLRNTPTKCAPGLDEDPFTTKSQLGNTPTKCATGHDEDPFTTKSQLGNTPTKCATGLDENPFTTKSQLGNTPTKCVSGLDEKPFTTKSQLGNTPGKCAPGLDEDPFTTKSQLGNTPTKCALGLDKNPITTRSQHEKMPEKCSPGPDENPITRSQHGKTLEMSAPEMQANFVAEKPNIKADQTVADARVICVEAINSQNKFADVLTDISQTVHRTENKSAVKGDDLITSRSRNCTLEGEETNVLPEGELPAITVLSSPAKEFELASSEEMEPFKENKMLNLSAAVSTSGGVLNGNNFFLTRPNFTENSVKDKTETKKEKSPNVALQPYEIGDFVAENDREAEQRLSAQSAVGNEANIETTEHPLQALENTDPNDLKSEWKVFDVLGNGEEFAKALEEHNPLLLASELELGIEENMFLPGTQVFSDPSAWELLEKFGGDAAKESDLRKQSLYVKFDPLVKPLTRSPEKMPAPAHAAPRKVAGRHTEINTSLLNNSSAEESLCLFGTPPRVARRRSILNQRRINASVSQTIAEEEAVKQVDLFFMNGEEDSHQFINDQSHKRLSAVTNLVQVEEIPKFTESEWLRMQQTLKLQYEGLMLSKEREFTSALQEERVKVTTLEEEVQKFKSKNKVLSDSVLSMKTVVAEYEKTLEVLIATKEKTTEEARRKVEALQAEKDQALDDVQAWDKSFSQLHCRYEKMKTVLEGFKKNEETLKTTIKTLQDKLKESEDKTVKVKACAEEKIAEVAKRLEQTKADNVRAEAELKRRQLQVQSLESTLEQKAKENKELTDLCETLINQVGGSRK